MVVADGMTWFFCAARRHFAAVCQITFAISGLAPFVEELVA